MNFDDYDITDNGDGTFTLTPKVPLTIDIAALLAEYRAIRDQGKALLAQRNDINATLTLLVARRDEIRAILVASGYTDPDDDGG
jgi:hypothetical protein